MSEQILKEILEGMQSLTKTVGNIETDQQTMKTDMQNMKSDIQFIKVDMQNMKSDIRFIKEEQQQIKQAVLETNETVIRIEAKQEHQQIVIDLLSARSIDQEASLKQIV